MSTVKVFLAASLFAFALPVFADDAAATGATEVVDAAAPAIAATLEGDQVVKVNTGNEAVDTLANTAIKCGERTAAFKACDSMGGFKAMGCRKVAEIRYKNVECPNL